MCVIVIKRAFPGGAGNIIIPTFRFRRRDKESADRVVATVGLLQDQPQPIQHSTSSAAAACKRLPFVIEILPHLRDYWKTGMDFRIHRSVHFKERVITCRRHHPGASRRLSLKSAQGGKRSHNNHAAFTSSSCFCWAGGEVMGVAGHSGRSIVIGRRGNHLDDMVA